MDSNLGLSSREASEREEQGLVNRMPVSRENGVFAILSRHLLTLFNLLNLVLAGLLFAVGSYRNMLFLGVVVSNAVIGTVQEFRAKRTHDRLELLGRGTVRVFRDSQETQLPPDTLVLDDVIRLSRGDQIPADAVLVSGALQADESLLTGESIPVSKNEGDLLYSGSFVVSGSALVRLTAVGAESYAGKLQLEARRVRRPKSRLMTDMKKIIRIVSVLVVPVGILLFLRQRLSLQASLSEAVTSSVAAVLGMIPEGLILLTSVSLTAGVIKLGSRNALVNELYGIEALARTDVVCMDKTGTLTSGEMKVEQVIPLAPYTREQALNWLAGHLASMREDSPTNRALAAACADQEEGFKAEAVVPFSSDRKWSASCSQDEGTFLLGAPEKLLQSSSGQLAELYALQGMRVLALCRSEEPVREDHLPASILPVALFCLRDSLRENVRQTVSYFGEQGVELKVISGDHVKTVASVAQAAGVPNASRAVDLSSLQAKDYADLAARYTVFGRVSPEDKCGLVQALKAQGHSVAMVGDGVNDIPAMKASDCSISLSGGSDAAGRVAQITLLNSDFHTLPQIVLEGRRVVNNITRASSLFLIKNILSLLLSLALLVLPYPYPFVPIQLTLISTLTIGLPSVVLALQPNQDRIRGSFLRNVILRALPGGVCASVLLLAVSVLTAPRSLSSEAFRTLGTYVAAASGWAALFLTCLPLDRLRIALVIVMGAALAGSALFLPGVFYFCPLQDSLRFLPFAALAASFPLQLGLSALIDRFRKTATEKQPKV